MDELVTRIQNMLVNELDLNDKDNYQWGHWYDSDKVLYVDVTNYGLNIAAEFRIDITEQ